MIEVADKYEINIPAHENKAYIAKAREVIATWEPQLEAEMREIQTAKSEKI